MPGIPGNEYRSALPKRVLCIVQSENSAAFQNIEGFVHPKVPVYRNARTDRHLLRSQGEIAGAFGGADLDEDVAGVAPMNEMFAFGGAEHITLWCCGLSLGQYCFLRSDELGWYHSAPHASTASNVGWWRLSDMADLADDVRY
jgi:hypothetical protein